jgi:hypothetical protein
MIKRAMTMGRLKTEGIADYLKAHDEIKNESLYPAQEEWLNHHPVCREFMALVKPLADPTVASVNLPEVFRLPIT